MKRIFLCFCLAVIAGNINAQVGIGTATPDASAQLEINSNNKGLLIPGWHRQTFCRLLQPVYWFIRQMLLSAFIIMMEQPGDLSAPILIRGD